MKRLSIGLALPSQISTDLEQALLRLHERAELSDAAEAGHHVVLRAASWPAARGERTIRWLDDADDEWLPDAHALVASPVTARRLRDDPDVRVPVVAFGPPRRHWNAVPVLPFTRTRIRAARGLDGAAVARLAQGSCTWNGQDVRPDRLDTVAALAAVVVALDGSAVIRAAAWAAPIVTSTEVADAVGMGFLGTSDEESAVAHLTADPIAAARLAHLAYEGYEQEHNPDSSFARIEGVAGQRMNGPEDGMTPYLDALRTPSRAAIRRRAAEAFAALGSQR